QDTPSRVGWGHCKEFARRTACRTDNRSSTPPRRPVRMHLSEPIRPPVPATAPAPQGRVRPAPATLPQPTPEAHGGVEGRLERYAPFASAHVEPRNVDVWLPPGYDDDPARRYPVVYMHDGQNLFVPELSFSGVDWGVDEAVAGLAAAGEIEAPVVVGVWNTPKRIAEYMPQQPVEE